MNSDDAYMLTLFLVGVAILVGMFTLILRSPLRRRAGSDEPEPPSRAEPADPTPEPSADVAPPARPARKLGALGCIWHTVAPHLSYTIPGVLIVSLLHGWFLIDWAAGVAEVDPDPRVRERIARSLVGDPAVGLHDLRLDLDHVDLLEAPRHQL
mgnify:CR=1 FL=1